MQKYFKILLLSALILLLFVAGCMTLPVRGQYQSGETKFSGEATGYMDGSGVIHITADNGLVCDGEFVYVTSRQGQGTFICTNGESGPFEFVSTGSRGTGTGMIGGNAVTFTFGK